MSNHSESPRPIPGTEWAFDPDSPLNRAIEEMLGRAAQFAQDVENDTMQMAIAEIESTLAPVDLDRLSSDGSAIDQRLEDIIHKAGQRT